MKTKLLFSALFLTAVMQAQTYTNNTSTPIPDADQGAGACGTNAIPGDITSDINVPLTATITDPSKVTINLNLAHTWMGDIVAELIPPGAASGCALIKRIGATTDLACGSGGDFNIANVLSFNSVNTTPIAGISTGNVPAGSYAPTGPIAGTYPAAVPLCNLSTFLNGVAVNGDWSLKMYDNGDDDTGTLGSWSLVFATGFDLSAQEFIYNYSVSVLGNPFENELVLAVNDPNAKAAKLSLYSMDGKLIHVRELNTINVSENIHIDTASFTQGVYLLIPEIDGRKQNAIKVVKR